MGGVTGRITTIFRQPKGDLLWYSLNHLACRESARKEINDHLVTLALVTNQAIQPVSKQTDEITSGRRQSFRMHLHRNSLRQKNTLCQFLLCKNLKITNPIVSYDARSVKKKVKQKFDATAQPSLASWLLQAFTQMHTNARTRCYWNSHAA